MKPAAPVTRTGRSGGSSIGARMDGVEDTEWARHNPLVPAEPASKRAGGGLAAILLVGLLALLLHLSMGSADDGNPWALHLSPVQVVKEIFAGDTGASPDNTIVWKLRLPRVLACFLVGAMLGVVGSA